MDAKDLDALWQSSQIRVTDILAMAPEVLFCNGSVIGTLGNFSASTGKAKSKKTFNVSAIVAAALTNGECLGYSAEFPDDKRTVLYFDTEQSPYHCQKVIRRAIELAGLPTDKHPDNLFFSQLRAQVPDTRLEIIDRAIATTPNVGLVVIDGIRDLMFDINNATESSRLINKLMEWTDNNQIHIHTVLHLNKSDDNVRGHVGTELNNKAETVLQVSKSATDDEVTEVSASCIRAMDFSPFAFRVNDNGLPEIAEGRRHQHGAWRRPVRRLRSLPQNAPRPQHRRSQTQIQGTAETKSSATPKTQNAPLTPSRRETPIPRRYFVFALL